MTAWLVMPFVMHWPTLTMDRLPLSVPVPDNTRPADIAMLDRPQPSLRSHQAGLGALRAVSFRGVTALDSDIYVAQFANGSAEWRIGVRNGAITKIALGPNF